jgi:hypothetical protein
MSNSTRCGDIIGGTILAGGRGWASSPTDGSRQQADLSADKLSSGGKPTLGDLGVQLRPLEEFLAVLKDKYN